MRSLAFVLIPLMAGCEYLLDDTDKDAVSTGDTGVDTPDDPTADDTGTTGDTTGDTGTTGGTTPDPGWSASFHPCVGNRTDVMWADDRDNLWVGCGSTTVGYGLFSSSDGGRTWSSPTTSPNGWFDDFRVSSIQRGDDGLLYVAGIYTLGSQRVVALDDSTSPGTILEVYNAGSTVGTSFHVGTFRRNSTGTAVAESLTGADLMARFDDGDDFVDSYGWWTSGSSFQILDMVLHDDAFYACGSTISEPPHVFLPPPGGQDPAAGFQLVPVNLSPGGIGAFDGELWGIDADASGIVAAGVDQGRDVGVIFTSGADPYDPAQWSMLDVSTVLGSDPTWMRGACRSGSTVIGVGEYSTRADGIVLRSDDGGASWSDVTPDSVGSVPSLHRCHIFDDGDVIVAGADGFFAAYEAN